ncbi:hypothetical protein [Streptantibioticus ferralitis]|uniref:Uncharacterized protein n=1 Tax=Streptantibioticus ferralitis TaxID=236510 RepID=A0ABT5Z1I0_9ACTN|nr:hypothetical protein [Streptantibioticus ferralitis]MDF2257623.1 hypothetical protein [Streptantibioticus ferralitis]
MAHTIARWGLTGARPPGRHSRKYFELPAHVRAAMGARITPLHDLRAMSDAEQHVRLRTVLQGLIAVDPSINGHGAIW